MKNRESLYPGRVKLTPVDAANGIYDLVRADEPQDPGTPLNKKLLDYAVAACGVTAGTLRRTRWMMNLAGLNWWMAQK